MQEKTCSAGVAGSIPGSGSSTGERNGNPLKYSFLENPMDRGAWRPTVHRVTRVGHDLVIKPPPKPGFSNMWTVNFQMFKLVLEKAEEPEIKVPASAGSLKKQESSRKTFISDLLTMPKPLTVWITINCGKFWDRNTRPTDLPLEKPVCRSGSNSLNWTWNNRLVPNRKRSTSRLYVVTLLI